MFICHACSLCYYHVVVVVIVVVDVDFISHEEFALDGLELDIFSTFLHFCIIVHLWSCFFVLFYIIKLQKDSKVTVYYMQNNIYASDGLFLLVLSDISPNAGIFNLKTAEMFLFSVNPSFGFVIYWKVTYSWCITSFFCGCFHCFCNDSSWPCTKSSENLELAWFKLKSVYCLYFNRFKLFHNVQFYAFFSCWKLCF